MIATELLIGVVGTVVGVLSTAFAGYTLWRDRVMI
jgi:hypothetical protein